MSTAMTPAPPETGSSLTTANVPHILDDLYRMSVDEYERLADSGCLKDRRVELINGWLVRKMTTKPPHVVAVDATREAISRLLPPTWWIRDEKPVRIPDFDEPEPDVSVVRGSRDDYRSRHPGPGDIELLVEVSDTSLAWDRGEKRAAYARGGCQLTGSSTWSIVGSRYSQPLRPMVTALARYSGQATAFPSSSTALKSA